MSLYLLDTNAVSQLVRKRAPHTVARLKTVSPNEVCVSIVSRAEILFGLAKVGHPPGLSHSVELFFQTTEILDWNEEAAQAYAHLRAACEAKGIGIAPLDLMIASHALCVGATLVTNDSALKRLAPWLPVEDWT